MSNKNVLCLFWNIRSNKIATVEKIFERLNPDILFLAEVENSNRGTIYPLLKDRGYECIKWVGDLEDKGLALYAKPGIVKDSYSAGNGEYCIAAQLYDREECLVGVWAKTEKPSRYCQHMQAIFDYYIANEAKPVFIGDFNVTPKVQKSQAVNLFRYFKDRDYESLYHMKRCIPIGDETDTTFVQVRNGDKHYYMLDYILCKSTSSDIFEYISEFKDWLDEGFSDHVPVLFEMR